MKVFALLTGQMWEYRVWQFLTVAAVVSTFAFLFLWQGNPLDLPEGLTTAIYLPICLLWFTWWAAAIRCPECRTSAAWHQITHGQAGGVYGRLAVKSVPFVASIPLKNGNE